MRRVCAWCKKDLKPNEEYDSEGGITHGICSFCAIKISSFKPRNIKELLNYVQQPVFLIDSDGIVRTANKSGLEMLGKKLEEIEYELGGDVFECSYASVEGGCGRTLHCTTCAIRNIVMDTLTTGQGYKSIPAFQSINTKDGTRILKFYISTEKVKECILLRIDKVSDINCEEMNLN